MQKKQILTTQRFRFKVRVNIPKSEVKKMGKLNLLKSSWSGKVGQTVGAKWKDKNTIRTFTAPSNPNTPAQQAQRSKFAVVSKFFAGFSDQLKSLSALDTRAMSVRNALIALNKAYMADATDINLSELQISRGGLPVPDITAGAATASGGTSAITWATITASNVSAKAKVVVVIANTTTNEARVTAGLASAGTLSAVVPTFEAGEALVAFAYLLDFRGSAKVGSRSVSVNVAV